MDEIQEKFLNIMREFKTQNERKIFLKWIHSNWDLDNLEDEENDCQSPRSVLNAIAEDIRPMVPFNSILASENINVPVCGPNSDCKANTTVHVDEFLYDDHYLNDLIDKELFSRHYCANCFSKNIKLLTFISHSMSSERIHFIFRCLLPPITSGSILDIGSRLGPVLYGAYMYTTCPNIIGVEINSEFCDIQAKILKKYKFDDRIKVICNNVCNELELVSTADIIVLNNVFEFFTDYETAITSWHLLAQNIKPGCILVTTPHLEDTFEHFKVEFNWREWVEVLKPHQLSSDIDKEDLENNLKNVRHYKVIKRFNEIK
ncbi:hypothetical protein RUM43_000741 [Polyplax serrata]|uniref:Methyltransferase type 11 domain-containing protein n=1 Tax=Polyplax serrata TaxID=468196 RepID=A0AAN8SDS9_POLSC